MSGFAASAAAIAPSSVSACAAAAEASSHAASASGRVSGEYWRLPRETARASAGSAVLGIAFTGLFPPAEGSRQPPRQDGALRIAEARVGVHERVHPHRHLLVQ